MPDLDRITIWPLGPGIELVTVRLFITTKSLTGPNSYPHFWWYTDFQLNEPHSHPMYIDRKEGETDLFERTFVQPLRYEDFQEARTATFRIANIGSDIWEIDHFTMTGFFKRFGMVLHPQADRFNQYVSWEWVDLGWRLMAYRDENIAADPASSAGGYHHRIVLNGTF